MEYRDCIHTPNVLCDRTTCKTCGWEPKEARRRMERIDRGELLKDRDGREYLPVKRSGQGDPA